MARRVLITLNDIKTYRPTAELDGSRWEPFALESQDQDLRPILGDGLYYDFMEEVFDSGDDMYADYQKLLNGTSYTLEGQTVYFDGIKPMLVYYTLARFVQNNPLHITRYGVVTKTIQQSTPADPQLIRQVVNELKSNAVTYKNQVDTYLLQNQSTFTLYIGSNTSLNNSFRMFKG